MVYLKSDTTQQGAIIAVAHGTSEDKYQVFINDGVQTFYASQLQLVEPKTGYTKISIAIFHACISSRQINHPNLSTLYSLNAARIDFIPYQFRPVLRFINADRPRLLIADSVGVGKTIEAGLIMRELQARSDINSILIICPKPLVTERKWQQEMKRFEAEFEHLDGAKLKYCLNELDMEGEWPNRSSNSRSNDRNDRDRNDNDSGYSFSYNNSGNSSADTPSDFALGSNDQGDSGSDTSIGDNNDNDASTVAGVFSDNETNSYLDSHQESFSFSDEEDKQEDTQVASIPESFQINTNQANTSQTDTKDNHVDVASINNAYNTFVAYDVFVANEKTVADVSDSGIIDSFGKGLEEASKLLEKAKVELESSLDAITDSLSERFVIGGSGDVYLKIGNPEPIPGERPLTGEDVEDIAINSVMGILPALRPIKYGDDAFDAIKATTGLGKKNPVSEAVEKGIKDNVKNAAGAGKKADGAVDTAKATKKTTGNIATAKDAVEKLTKDSNLGRKTKGRTEQHIKEGGYEQANIEFDSLNLSNVKPIGNIGRVGTLEDGTKVVVRSKSSDGRPTIEIQSKPRKTEIRYND